MSHVDSNAITHVSLCSGYGGIDLGLKRVLGERFRTVAYCEIEAFAVANLVSKASQGWLDNAPLWSDLKRFPWGKFRGLVDILSGGYPCQPFSAAGKRLGTEDPRHLWPYIADGIAAMRPSACFFENVEGHISLGLPDVIEDLGRLGYRTTWGIFSASEVGAPHQRKRVFIMAHLRGSGFPRHGGLEQVGLPQRRETSEGCLTEGGGSSCEGLLWPSRPGQPQHEWEPPRVVGNSESRKDNGREPGDMGEEASQRGCGNNAADGASEGLADHQQQCGLRGSHGISRGKRDSGISGTDAGSECSLGTQCKAEPSMGGDLNGTSDRMDYAELSEPDHAAGGCDPESRGGELDNSTSRGCNWVNARSGRNVGRWNEAQDLGSEVENSSSSNGASHPDLYVSCDNRTDELRLLGNGVVPATAELAFRTLWEELTA